jgi:glycosyltransferase 2 family protein
VKLKWKMVVVLKTLVSVGLLTLILTRVDLGKAVAGLNYLSVSFIAFALAFYTGCQWLSCLRWQVILRATGHRVDVVTLLRCYFAGMFLNVFLPGALGGDVYRVYRVGRQTGDAEAAFVSVFLERFTGLGALALLALLGLPVSFGLMGSWDIQVLFVGCLAALAGAVLLIASRTLLGRAEPWLRRLCLGGLVARLARIQELLRVFARHRRALLLSVGISLGLQVAIVTYHYLVARQLHIDISFLEMLVFIPIVAVITLLPISLGGLGVKEGLWVYLFSRNGLTAEQALLLSVTLTGLSWLLALPGGGVLLLDAVRGRAGVGAAARRPEAMRAA